MKKNTISYLLILVGSAIAIYADAEEQQNLILLVVGIIILIVGIYRISSTIESKTDKEDTVNYKEDKNEI
ncbi:hypothetical protein ES677_05840 [Bizionia gelidisalsuginis]|uniref:Uncharacterized protein n=2 Tax=Bizionia TaxID=283785 RepID=A0A8H2LEC6_9FLAO|nr:MULTISPECIES: hypothetical protein [Bizionia]TYB73132.1 hypothetical protein ES676_10275 [Bizionia saleffrena]TYC14901.1 hypothetical protein ES677_05840 [Bizionia gelidisalsuginis]